jgi:hypothetical protein
MRTMVFHLPRRLMLKNRHFQASWRPPPAFMSSATLPSRKRESNHFPVQPQPVAA